MIIPFIELKSQYQALKPQIQARIDAVLERGQYIMGPDVKELEDKLAACTGDKHCITCAQYTVIVRNREALQKRLAKVGIPTVKHYPVPLNEQPAYKHLCCQDGMPVAQ